MRKNANTKLMLWFLSTKRYILYGNENAMPPKVNTLLMPKKIDVENKYKASKDEYDTALNIFTLNILQVINHRVNNICIF